MRQMIKAMLLILSIAIFLGLISIYSHFSIGQDAPAAPAEAGVAESVTDGFETAEPLVIKLSVNEVRLDVVVLDNKGNPVTDLTTKDFEIFQNDTRQNVISSVYIDNQPDSASKPFPAQKPAQKETRNIPPLPSVDLKREDTGRSIILLVDDLSMSFENLHFARMSLRNYVEKQMQTGDMAAILRTGYGNSALQLFLSDKREALARIDAMRMERALYPNFDGSHLYRIYDNQLSAISYSLHALKDMPGRKILVVITAAPTIRKPDNNFLMIMDGGGAQIQGIDFHDIYNERFSRLADDALRAGVVVNFLNINGLETNKPKIQDILDALDIYQELQNQYEKIEDVSLGAIDKKRSANNKAVNETIQNIFLFGAEELKRAIEIAVAQSGSKQMQLATVAQLVPHIIETAQNSDPRNALNPLPVKTGGVIIENSNFFLDGLGRETENLMKGYYLISYSPPSGTFGSGDKETAKEIFNKIKVNVNRRGVKVYTRDGFYNRLENQTDNAPAAHPLQDAVFSPFTHTGLEVNVSAGYVKDARSGHLVRSWIHVDPKDIMIVETEDGGARIDLRMVCLTSDTNGVVQDSKFIEHTLTIEPENKAENLAFIQKHGIRFAMLLPVKNPGFYYVRVAVEDKESGKTGSAYQSVEIPDPKRKGLALSNIFMIPGVGDLNWLLSDATAESAEGLFFPVFQAEEVRSPALRTYASGDSLQILAMLYNADEKAVAGSELELLFVLYRDGKEFLRNGIPVGAGSAGNFEGIPLMLRLTMGTDIPPGDYVLELRVSDKKNSARREGSASQAISFTVIEKIS